MTILIILCKNCFFFQLKPHLMFNVSDKNINCLKINYSSNDCHYEKLQIYFYNYVMKFIISTNFFLW